MIYYELYKKRKNIYYDFINGKYSNIRLFSILFSLFFFFLLPFLRYNNNQAILFDIINYKIYFFGYIFYPNDFVLFCVFILIILIIFFLVTLLYGRLWCGYLCPQTITLYFFQFFSKIFEGTRNNRIKIENMFFNSYVFFIKIFKHFLFFIFLFLVSLCFVGYFIPILPLLKNVLLLNFNNLTFFIIFFITSLLYFELIFLGEQFCFLICPYARFQNIMYDESTIIVKYDIFRGEPKKSKKKNVNFGDCINCLQCVYSCPTGIDIRNGVQIECINCGVCVDACNNVMLKVNRDKNLIFYNRDYNISLFVEILFKKKKFIFVFFLIILYFIFFYLFFNRLDLDFFVNRNQYTLYNLLENNIVENNYVVKIINKTNNNIFCYLNAYSIDDILINYIGPYELSLYPDCINNIYVKIQSFFENELFNKKFYKIFFYIKYNKNEINIFLKKEVNFFIF